jgi:FdhD protein
MSHSDSLPVQFNLDASAQYTVKRYQIAAQYQQDVDMLAEEVPIAMIFNGISHVVMLATPQDLEDFALGFSLSEGIIDTAADLYGVESVPQSNGIALHLEIATECFQRLKEKRRNMTGRTGCGLCGSESLSQALHMPSHIQVNHLLASLTQQPKISAHTLALAFRNIRDLQVLQKSTGATHASAFVNTHGEITVLREDVGRHNALDKLIGALKKSPNNELGFILTTSRASYEMVQKTICAGIPMLAAISAPTGLAVRIAEHYGMTLVGFVREESFVVYADAKNIMR